jgi:drug/metabolite transporter (DMT)-like permease
MPNTARPDPLARHAKAVARRRVALVLLVITPGLWSANYIVARAAVGVIEPHLLAFMRWLFALGLMLPFAWRSLLDHRRAWRREWRRMLVLGGLGMWICGAFVYIGANTTSATNIGLLYALAPVMIAAGSAVFFGERMTPTQIAGVATAMAGMLFVLAKGSPANLAQVRFTVGDGWIVAAVVSWTVYSLLLRRWPSALEPFPRLAVITAAGLIVLAPFTLIEAGFGGLPDFGSPKVWVLTLVAAALPGFGAYQAYSYMQRELGPARTGLVLYLGPLWAAGAAWWLLGEAPRWYHFAGAALILPGIYLATRSAKLASARTVADGDAAA